MKTLEEMLKNLEELREQKLLEYGPDYVTYTLEEDPSGLKEALSSLDAYLWQEAINDEMDSLQSNAM